MSSASRNAIRSPIARMTPAFRAEAGPAFGLPHDRSRSVEAEAAAGREADQDRFAIERFVRDAFVVDAENPFVHEDSAFPGRPNRTCRYRACRCPCSAARDPIQKHGPLARASPLAVAAAVR
jgi:hypothetical protein